MGLGDKPIFNQGGPMDPVNLAYRPIHLGRHGTAVVEPAFDGDMNWYEAYGARHEADGAEGRLVSLHTFAEPWTSWEMHPSGHEAVVCVSGSITLHQEHADGTITPVIIGPGEYVINDPGVWHTADVDAEATALFITAGLGTQVRPR
jgi:quercetin dioxygenase-like cupin family protein